MPRTAASQLPPAASMAACAPSILKTPGEEAGRRLGRQYIDQKRQRAPGDAGAQPLLACLHVHEPHVGSTRIAGPTAQKPTMAPSVFSMRSSTSNRRYGCAYRPHNPVICDVS